MSDPCPHEFWEREASVATEGYCPICMARHITALTAAAEVWKRQRDADDAIVAEAAALAVRKLILEAFERCAQVVEDYDPEDTAVSGRGVLAARIRALKDKP